MKAAVTAAALGLGAAWLWSTRARGLKPLEGTFAPNVEITQDAKKSSPVYERNQSIIKKLGALCPKALEWLGSVDANAAEKAALACGVIGDINNPDFLRGVCTAKVSGEIKGTFGDGRAVLEAKAAEFGCAQVFELLESITGNAHMVGEATRIASAGLGCAALAGPVAGIACFGIAGTESAFSGRNAPQVNCFVEVGGEEVEVSCGGGKCDKERAPRLFTFYNSITRRVTTALEKGPKVTFNALGLPTGTSGETYYLFERDDETCRWHQREATPREIELYVK